VEGVSCGALGRPVSCKKVEADGGRARRLLVEAGEKEEGEGQLGTWERRKKGGPVRRCLTRVVGRAPGERRGRRQQAPDGMPTRRAYRG
jgi:hypothetical protein